MTGSLKDQTVLVAGPGGGFAHAIALAARHARAQVAAAGRGQDTLAAAYPGEPGITIETVDFTDEASIRVNAISPGVVDTAAWDTLGEPLT
jgi:NAD(P)-dependent dehydrogenase (short-subunit alcohol dehydrogenase family)